MGAKGERRCRLHSKSGRGRGPGGVYSYLGTWTVSCRFAKESVTNWIGSDGGSYSYLRTSSAVRTPFNARPKARRETGKGGGGREGREEGGNRGGRIYIYIYTHTHTYIHTYIYKYIYIYIHIYVCMWYTIHARVKHRDASPFSQPRNCRRKENSSRSHPPPRTPGLHNKIPAHKIFARVWVRKDENLVMETGCT